MQKIKKKKIDKEKKMMTTTGKITMLLQQIVGKSGWTKKEKKGERTAPSLLFQIKPRVIIKYQQKTPL